MIGVRRTYRAMLKPCAVASGSTSTACGASHGVGHGLMAWTSYELLDALGFCDRLADDRDRQSSSSGSAMLQRNGPADKVRSLGRVRICDILS